MTHITFDEWACRNTQAKLDSYIDNELLVETNLEMAQHFQRCGECAREAAQRREIRGRLKAAARKAALPEGLESRLRDRLHEAARPNSTRWRMMSIAAMLAVCFASRLGYDRVGFPVPLLRVGEGNHVHCAVIRQAITKPVGLDKLAPEYKPLLAVARESVPVDMRLTVAHECANQGRKFVHMTFKNDRRMLSVLVTRRQDGEALSGIRAGRVDGYQAAGFETGEFLVYTVSDLSRRENMRVLEAIAPGMRVALGRMS